MFERDRATSGARWLAGSTYRGRWREMVDRSAITLKLMTYAPTGAPGRRADRRPARAGRRRAQLGLPLHLGPRRARSRSTPCSASASPRRPRRSCSWLGDRVARAAGDGAGPAEDHVPGRRLLRPRRGDPRPLRGLPRLAARCGSATAPPTSSSSTSTARRWTAIYLADRHGLARRPRRAGRDLAGIARLARATTGTSPTRASGRPAAAAQDFTYGRLMCWVAFDRGDPAGHRRAAARPTSPGGRASATASTSRSWTAAGTPKREAFVQHYDTDVLDASLLLHAARSASSPRSDPMWLSTLRRDGRGAGLRQPGLPLRPGRLTRRAARLRGHVLVCTFWYVDALARSGRLDEARLTFEKMLTYANHLGPVLRGDRADRRAARQLPAGVHPPVADQRRDQPRLPARPGGAGRGRQGRGQSSCAR